MDPRRNLILDVLITLSWFKRIIRVKFLFSACSTFKAWVCLTAHLKAKHRKFTVGKRKAEEVIPEIHKYINIQVGQRIPVNLIQFHSFLILSGSKKDFFNYCYIAPIKWNREHGRVHKGLCQIWKPLAILIVRVSGDLDHDCYWTLERMFSSTTLANKGLKLKIWSFISTYYALLIIRKDGICLHAHLNLYTGNDFTYWEVLMNYQLLLFLSYKKSIWAKRIEIKESKYFSKDKLNCCNLVQGNALNSVEMTWIWP